LPAISIVGCEEAWEREERRVRLKCCNPQLMQEGERENPKWKKKYQILGPLPNSVTGDAGTTPSFDEVAFERFYTLAPHSRITSYRLKSATGADAIFGMLQLTRSQHTLFGTPPHHTVCKRSTHHHCCHLRHGTGVSKFGGLRTKARLQATLPVLFS